MSFNPLKRVFFSATEGYFRLGVSRIRPRIGLTRSLESRSGRSILPILSFVQSHNQLSPHLAGRAKPPPVSRFMRLAPTPPPYPRPNSEIGHLRSEISHGALTGFTI